MADEIDLLTVRQEKEMELLMAERASAPQEDPDEDERGNRYCLDCAEIIPAERVAAVRAVRCVSCATKRERFRKLASQPGGAVNRW